MQTASSFEYVNDLLTDDSTSVTRPVSPLPDGGTQPIDRLSLPCNGNCSWSTFSGKIIATRRRLAQCHCRDGQSNLLQSNCETFSYSDPRPNKFKSVHSRIAAGFGDQGLNPVQFYPTFAGVFNPKRRYAVWGDRKNTSYNYISCLFE
jgi:hypothetical protein